MGIPDHLTCLLRNLYAGQEATVRTRHGTTDWFQIGKGVCQGCILSPCLFNLHAEYIMRNAGLEEAQVGIKIAGRNINNLRYADASTLMTESEDFFKEVFKEPLDESERGEWKRWFITPHSKNKDHGIWSHHLMANRCGNNGNSDRRYFLGLQIAPDGNCSHEIKRHLFLGRTALTNLDCILKSRDITLPAKVSLVKVLVFPVVMYGCESQTLKKAER